MTGDLAVLIGPLHCEWPAMGRIAHPFNEDPLPVGRFGTPLIHSRQGACDLPTDPDNEIATARRDMRSSETEDD
jgi:hypothetical protein